MPEIRHNELQKYLADLRNQADAALDVFAPVYLIFGEEYLCNSSFDALLNTLLPESRRALSCETFAGDDVDIFEVIELLNTFSMMEGPKVVTVRNAQFFSSGVSSTGADTQALQKAVEKGFLAHHHLIVTTDSVDKRRCLYQVIKDKGIIIDCAVPKGNRMADRKARDLILAEKIKAMLAQHGKTMHRSVYQALTDLTGFDLHTCMANLEKLITYVADRSEISEADIQNLLERTRQDPVYELTGAVLERDVEKSFFYLGSLLKGGMYPLQILAALINQFRKLMLMKAFASSAGNWYPQISFNRFKQDVLPAIKEYDAITLTRMKEWGKLLNPETDTFAEKTKKKKTSATDLLIAKNATTPYPVYLQLQKTEKFTHEELFDVSEYLHEADLRLKTTGDNPRIILENLILHICRGEEHVENQNRMHHRSLM